MPRFTEFGAGEWIYEKLEGTGSTSPTNTQVLGSAEGGFCTFFLDGADSSKTEGDAKALMLSTASIDDPSLLGLAVQKPHATSAPEQGVVGILAKSVANSGVWVEIQVYGFHTSCDLGADVDKGDLLQASNGDDDLYEVSTGYVQFERPIGMALEDSGSNKDVFLFAM